MNILLLSGDLGTIKATMTPTMFKGYLKGRILELRLLCSEKDVDVAAIQEAIVKFEEEQAKMESKPSATSEFETGDNEETVDEKAESKQDEA